MRSVRLASLSALLVAGIGFGWSCLGDPVDCLLDSPAMAAERQPVATSEISLPKESVPVPAPAAGRATDLEELLFQPMIFPGLGGSVAGSECRFSDDPYSNCL